MTYFTSSPLERIMQAVPKPGKQERKITPAPEGHFCFGCSHYGLGCVRLCYRDKPEREKSRDRGRD